MVAGVCYGMVANNLPSPSDVVQLYRNKGITGMRIYSPDPTALTALRSSGISLIIDIGGTDQLAYLAASGSNAAAWVRANVQAYQGLTIKYIVAGNEVQGADTQNIVPAIRNLNAALSAVGLGGIKVSTAARFDAVTNTFPPSNGVFAQPYMTDVARLLASTGAPLLVNIYPYFAYRDDPTDIQLSYATFQPSATPVRDGNNGLTYTCLFDAMVDAVYAAMEKAGTPGLRLVVSESGWPSASGFAATADNARAYNQGLINHVGGGTPKRPGTLETYIFAMFNENFKLGDLVEKHFGLFNPDKSPAYPIQF